MATPTPLVTLLPADPSASVREWITAIGTVLAVVVALIIAMAPVIVGWFRKPKLQTEVSDTGPHVRLAHTTSGPNAMFLRMTVRNAGSVEARRVRVTLTDWYVLEPVEGSPEWARLDTDPAALHWVSMSHAREERPRIVGNVFVHSGQAVPADELVIRTTPPEVNMPPGHHDLVDIAVLLSDQLRIVLDDNRERGFRQEAPFPDRQFKMTISVSAENARGFTQTLCFRTQLGDGFKDVGFCDPPIAARDAGLWPMLNAVVQELRQSRIEEGVALAKPPDSG